MLDHRAPEPGDAIGALDWTAQERESFFAAIERHRRAVWQVGLVSTLCVGVLACVVAMLMAPLFYAVLGILLDVGNLAFATPDVIGMVMTALGPLVDRPETVPASRWLYVSFVAACPGLGAMWLLFATLRRIVREAEAGDLQGAAVREAIPSNLPERRFGNVIAEMAIAANIPAPRLLIVNSSSANAGVLGEHAGSATILVSEGLLGLLSRAQLQGVAGHLMGLIANGDVPAGMRIAQTLSLFGFVARLSDGIVDPPAFRRFASVFRQALRRGASSADAELILQLTSPMAGRDPVASEPQRASNKLTWREWARMPLYGPLVMSGFLGGAVSSALLGPLIALVWRRRKYMADATATRLTRDPDALAGALLTLRGTASSDALPAWTAHMGVVPSPSQRGMLSGSAARLYPSLDGRLAALSRLGATVKPPERRERRVPAAAWVLLGPIAALCAGLFAVAMCLLVWVSVALSGLFTWMPAILLHALLRKGSGNW